jgi:tRNA threonylcarbamoyladenosine biosynthesis protein TsaB
MNVLAVETSTERCSVSLITATTEIEKHVVAPKGQATLIIRMADQILEESNLIKSDLSAVAFGCGPGSFNGIRVAASFAHGLALAQDIDIVPCSTLHALAMTPNPTISTNVLVISDARKNEIYWSCLRLSAQNQVEEIVIESKVTSPSCVSVPEGASWSIVSSKWLEYEKLLSPEVRALPRISCDYPSALPIAKFASYSLERNMKFLPTESMPVYLRNPA